MSKRADSAFKILTFAVWLFLLFTGFYDLFHFPEGSLVWFGSFLVLVIVYFKFRSLPNYVHFFLAFIILCHIFGELYFRFFYTFESYDKILHFINPIFISVFAYNLAKGRIKDKHMLLIFSVCVTISLGVMWEIFEYLFDHAFGGFMQGVYSQGVQTSFNNGLVQDRLNDTMIDLVLDVCGAVVFWFINIFYHNRKALRIKK